MQTPFTNTTPAYNMLFNSAIVNPTNEGSSAAYLDPSGKKHAKSGPVNDNLLKKNVQVANEYAVELIEMITDRAGISIPAAYLKVEGEGLFQILIFIRQEDFLSTRRIAARFLADEYLKTVKEIDMKITFSNYEVNNKKQVFAQRIYTPKGFGPDFDMSDLNVPYEHEHTY